MGRIYNVTQRAVGIILNSNLRARFLFRRINVHIEHIKFSKGRDSFLKRKEKVQEKKKAKEKGTWVQLKLHPALPKEAQFVRTMERSLSCWNLFPMNVWHNGC
jgi:large subunit ribosomal protein L21e